VDIPANALPSDLTIKIAVVKDTPTPPTGTFGINFAFSPSSVQFSAPVTITIPYNQATAPAYRRYTMAWYDPLTGTWSSDGIGRVQHTVISPTLETVSFTTTHFTAFASGGSGTPPPPPPPPPPPNPNPNPTHNNGGTCFIATSAYEVQGFSPTSILQTNFTGQYLITPERLQKLDEIRGLRDTVLLELPGGRVFSAWYYAVGPYAATAIRHNEPAKALVRAVLLNPLAELSRSCLEAEK
jgi:hypothetical protein